MNLQLFAINNHYKFDDGSEWKNDRKKDESVIAIAPILGANIASANKVYGSTTNGTVAGGSKGITSATGGITAGGKIGAGSGKGNTATGSGTGASVGGSAGLYVNNPEVSTLIAGSPNSVAENPILSGISVSDFAQSDESKERDAFASEMYNNLLAMGTPSASFSASPFQASQAYQEAMKVTNELLEKLSTGRTSYTDQIKAMMEQIQGREKFSYNVDDDTLFQQALASAMSSGKQAMQDTIGQASALTGGYGSTYATSAGNQAYNAFIEDAYDNLPEYYQMALEAYQMEGQEMYNQLNMLNQADATEYQRLYNSWDANFTNAQNMYNQEYNYWRDSNDFAYKSASLDLQAQGMAYDQALSTYQMAQNSADKLYNREYQSWLDTTQNALDIYQTNLDNKYRYDVIDNNNEQAELDRQWKSDEAQTERDWEDTWNVAKYDVNGDGKVDVNDHIAETSAGNGAGASYSSLTSSDINTLKDIYTKAGGGTAGYEAVDRHLGLLGKNNLSDEALAGLEAELGTINIPSVYDNWTIQDDTRNWLGFLGIDDNNDVYTNGSETKTLKELIREIEDSDLNDFEKEALIKSLKEQSKK